MATTDVIPVNPVGKRSDDGALSKFIPQKSPSFLTMSNGSVEYEMVFKGSVKGWYSFQNFLMEAKKDGKEYSAFIDDSTALIDWNSSLYATGTPSPIYHLLRPRGNNSDPKYVLDSWSMEECEAGKHCIVRVHFVEDGSDDDEPDYTYWQCRMQPTQIDVLAYCSNKAKQGETGEPGEQDKGTYATRIQAWWNQPTDTAWLKPTYRFQSIVGANNIQQLNSAETKIAKYLEAGDKPLRHYPVIIKKQVYTGKPKIKFDLIDHIVTESQMNDGLKDSEENPFDLDGWEWLCTGIDAEYNTTTKTTTVSTEYTGSESWDKHFYGDEDAQGDAKRWAFGAVYVD